MRITHKTLIILILISSIFSQGEKEIIIEKEKIIIFDVIIINQYFSL